MIETIAFNPIYLKTNQGHGNARRTSLEGCHNELVALMDADDVSTPERFQLQLQRFKDDKRLSVVGGQILEFAGEISNVIGIRSVPEINKDIVDYAKKRCPMNQMTVMFKKTAVDEAGGYKDWYCNEDYYLWLRMIERNKVFENLPEILVNVRAGNEMSSRRGGWRYFSSEAKLQKYMLSKRIISFQRYCFNVAIRFGGEVVLSSKLRSKVFKMLRKNTINIENDRLVSDTVNVQDEFRTCNNKEYPPFSVAICVYGKDNPEWFDTALESIIVNQTVKPSEVVLVVDGPVPEGIHKVIDKYSKICEGGKTQSN